MEGNNDSQKSEGSVSNTSIDTQGLMENIANIGGSADLSALLGSLLGDAELMSRIRKIADASTDTASTATTEEAPSQRGGTADRPTSAPPSTGGLPDIGGLLSSPELMSKLPEVLEAIKPLVKTGKPHSDAPDKRLALLCALKPYMSEHRREAIDYITKINKLGSIFKNLKL